MIKIIFTDSGLMMILKDVNGKNAKVVISAADKRARKIRKILEKVWKR